jgi:hypothetical protein
MENQKELQAGKLEALLRYEPSTPKLSQECYICTKLCIGLLYSLNLANEEQKDILKLIQGDSDINSYTTLL